MFMRNAAARAALLILAAVSATAARADDVVRLGNLKFAHYGAVSYMKELGMGNDRYVLIDLDRDAPRQ